MKLNCGLTRKEKKKLEEEWHDWFAWRPIRVGSDECLWFETVERRLLGVSWEGIRVYEYRAIK